MSDLVIDDVIAQLDVIIENCHERGSRLGFFPAMYRKTTLEVKKGIQAGRFEDPARLEQLDVIFAERYFRAVQQYEQGTAPTRAWDYAFQMGDSPDPNVIQHLLLGMNAHINLDLGISAAEIAPGDSLPALKHDFDEINDILGELIDRVQEDLTSAFPALNTLDTLVGNLDERMLHFSIRKARASAWRKAELLAPLDSSAEVASHIEAFDDEVYRFAQIICPPQQPLLFRRDHAENDSPEDIRRIIQALVD